MDAGRIHRVMSGEDDALSAFLLRCAAACVEPLYAGAVSFRNWLYDAGVMRTHAAPAPVISVGNITTGGTGKTPMVIHIARLLQQHGVRPAVLMRGYGGTEAAHSDEHRLILRALHDVPVIAEADRAAAAHRLAETHPEVTAIILDDGFQHRRLRRDLDLVLVDASNPFGYGRVLPRGMLREPVDGLRRASAVVITHAEQVSARELAALDERIERHHGRPALAVYRHEWTGIIDHADQPAAGCGAHGSRVFAACGIGNPAAFIAQAKAAMNVIGTRVFADHHAYTPADAERLIADARAASADAVLVTEKDWVKLRGVIKSPPAIPFWRPVLSIACVRGEKALEQRLIEATRAVTSPI